MEILFYFLFGFGVVGLIGFLYFENKSIVTTRHLLKFEFLPHEFDGFTIVHLSDLHSKWFGKDQYRLVSAIQKAKPDIIVITGDMVDELFFKEEPFLALVRQLHDVAPIYYVSGNHEWDSGRYEPLRDRLIELGVFVLDNRVETIERNGKAIAIAGLDDYARYKKGAGSKKSVQTASVLCAAIDKIHTIGNVDDHARYGDGEGPRVLIHRQLGAVRDLIDERAFKILLVHRPEWLREYMEHHFSVIFSGHAHGGQWNLPVLGPIFAPGQGLFPKLTSGVHRRHNNTFMVISRGLGNSTIAFQRLFNRPEVVVVVLKQII